MLTIHPKPGKAKSRMLCEAFTRGAPPHAVGGVFFGLEEPMASAWRALRSQGIDCYAIDNAYFDATRGQRFRVAKNRMQVRAVDHTSNGRRFAALGIEVRPWQRNPDGHVVLVEQSPAFMRDVAEDPQWFAKALLLPGAVRVRPWSANKPHLAATLADDLRGAGLLHTHSSAAAVEALIAGVPVLVSPMSAVYDWTSDNRLQLLNVLADHEFTLDELQDGTAWRRLNL